MSFRTLRFLVLVVGLSAWAQTQSAPEDHFRIHTGQSLTGSERHYVVTVQNDEERQALLDQGARLLLRLTGSQMIVAFPQNPHSLTRSRVARIGTESKWSSLVDRRAAQAAVLVEFHRDVLPMEAESVLAAEGILWQGHPDLLPYHYLVNAPMERLSRLAGWDEVAYLFPASRELQRGEAVHACAGAITTSGPPTAQAVPVIGDGWDGPDLGSADLKYVFSAGTPKIADAQAMAEILRAMNAWGQVAKISFSPGTLATAEKTINILFASGDHGDGYPFDGPGRVLAHTFYPAPPNPEPIAGDFHLDADEAWKVGADIDLFSVALHELGHALGLGHTSDPSAVMYPYYRMAAGLGIPDRAAILSLYAPAGSTTPPTPLALLLTLTNPAQPAVSTTSPAIDIHGTISGGTGPYTLSWASDRGASGSGAGSVNWTISQAALTTGTNAITITATDAAQHRTSQSLQVTRLADLSPPTVQISGAAASGRMTVTTSSATISGTASHSSGIQKVDWSNNKGDSGTGTGTTNWTTGPMPLLSGDNSITLKVVANSGAMTTATVVVSYQPAVPADKTPPTLTIAQPLNNTVITTATALVRGAAQDNVGVTQVSWSLPSGANGIATGTTSWQAQVPLPLGSNTLTVRARDAAGNTTVRTLVMIRH